MTKEDIIRMAEQAGMERCKCEPRCHLHTGGMGSLTYFADLVAAAEREACAKLCEDSVPTYTKDGERWLKGRNGKPDVRLKDLAPNLEAAWEQEQLLRKNSALKDIATGHILATAIRARGQHD